MNNTKPLAGECILIVEDDAMQALDLSAGLIDAGASILGPAANVNEAVTLLSTTACSAAVLDLRVGDRNATSLAKHFLEHRIPFMIYTGYPDSAFFRSDWGGYRLISKPADIGELIRILADLISHFRREFHQPTQDA
jgi:DNA-binding NtrC family response regulator